MNEEAERGIKEAEERIEDLEKKRLRSQSSIVSSLLEGSTPDARDAEYFRTLTSLIDLERENLRLLMSGSVEEKGAEPASKRPVKAAKAPRGNNDPQIIITKKRK